MQSRWNPTPPRGKLGLGPSTSQPRPSRQAYVFGPCFALTPFQRIPPDRYSRKNVPICPTRTVGESAFPFVPTESYRRVVLHAVFIASRLSVRRKRTPSSAAQRRESCKAHPRDDPAIKMTDCCVRLGITHAKPKDSTVPKGVQPDDGRHPVVYNSGRHSAAL